MSCELTGKLIEILQPAKGEGRNGTWEKQPFVIETSEQYPKKICIMLWNDKAAMIRNFNVGDTLKVSVNVASREYNGNWYTDVTAWRIDKEAEEGMGLPPADELPPDMSAPEDDLPF